MSLKHLRPQSRTMNPIIHDTFRHCRVRFCWTTFLETAVYKKETVAATCTRSRDTLLFNSCLECACTCLLACCGPPLGVPLFLSLGLNELRGRFVAITFIMSWFKQPTWLRSASWCLFILSPLVETLIPSYPGRAELTSLCKIQPTVYVRIVNLSRWARQLGWSILASAL